MMFALFRKPEHEQRPRPVSRNEVVIKLLLIGDSAVGKTCLLVRFTNDSFNPSFLSTIGIDFRFKNIEYNDCTLRLQIWDTAGQEKFRTITTPYYRNAMGVLLVYDITNEASFHNVMNWMKNIQEYAPPTVSTVLVGNKSDMGSDRVISTERGEALAAEFGIPFLETSARTNDGVEEAFMMLSKEIYTRLIANRSPSTLLTEERPPDPIIITDSWFNRTCCSS